MRGGLAALSLVLHAAVLVAPIPPGPAPTGRDEIVVEILPGAMVAAEDELELAAAVGAADAIAPSDAPPSAPRPPDAAPPRLDERTPQVPEPAEEASARVEPTDPLPPTTVVAVPFDGGRVLDPVAIVIPAAIGRVSPTSVPAGEVVARSSPSSLGPAAAALVPSGDGSASGEGEAGIAAGAPSAGSAEAGALGSGGTSNAAASYRASVRSRIDRAKRYPPSLRAFGIEGRVTVAFTIQADGGAANVRCVTGGPTVVMDQAACAAVRAAAPFPPPPGGEALDLRVTLVFRLEAAG